MATVHRPVDLARGFAALVGLSAVLGSIRALPLGSDEISADVSRWVSHFPHWLAYAGALVAELVAVGLLVAATVVLVRIRPRGALRAWAAAVVAWVAASAAQALWHTQHGTVAYSLGHGTGAFVFAGDAAFLAFMLASDLLHRRNWVQWTTGCGGALLLFDLADGTLSAFAFVIAVLWGGAVGWGMRWALGIASDAPGRAELSEWLNGQKLGAVKLDSERRETGHLIYGLLEDGRRIEIRMATTDTQWSSTARWLWAAVRLKSTATGRTAATSRSRLEDLALVCALTDKAAIPAPELLVFSAGPHGSLGLVTTRPKGEPVGAELSAGVATSLFDSLSALHQTGVAHRDLRSTNLLATGGRGGFSDIYSALPGATRLARLLDVAQLVTTVAQLAGPDVAVQAMRDGYRDLDESAVASVLQPVSLASWGWSEARKAKGCLEAVRARLVHPGETVPSIQLERFSWRTVISAVALVIATYVLVGQLSRVNLVGTLSHMKWQWFIVALAASAVTYLAAACNLSAFVRQRLPLVKTFLVQLAATFVGVALPSAVGSVTVNARYLTKQGVSESDAAADIALSQVVSVVTTIILVVMLVLITGASASRVKLAPSTDLLLVVGGVVLLVALLALVPRTRDFLLHTVLPQVKALIPKLLQALSEPSRLAASAGSSLLLNAAYVTAFLASLNAVGAHPSILASAVVYIFAGFIGSSTPTPGGVGGVEAALIAGLAGIGVHAAQAVPAVIVFRFATFWLPIPIGWLSYQGLQRSDTL